MTREEAILMLSNRDAHGVPCGYTSGYQEAFDMAVEALKELPKRRKEAKRWKRKALQQERPRGKWIYGNGNGECPFCGHERQLGWDNFCGFCGADMRGERSRTSIRKVLQKLRSKDERR